MISIVKATIQDIPLLLSLINKAYRGESSRRGWTHELDFLQGDMRIDEIQLHEIISAENGTLLLAKKEDIIIGSMHLRHDKDRLYLGLLSVDPDKQDAGTGRALLAAADAYALQNHFSSIFMVVVSERTELINWYIRRGYTLTNYKKPFEVDPKFGIPTRELFFVELYKMV